MSYVYIVAGGLLSITMAMLPPFYRQPYAEPHRLPSPLPLHGLLYHRPAALSPTSTCTNRHYGA